jgi:glycosyltransferase involved in cell wall biosynthesis
MKISIITATFNREKTIVRALESIKNQTYKNIQVVVIDGASSDNTIKLIKPILDQNDLLVSEPDDGIYQALNKGLSHSDGDIVAFLHSDDIYSNNNVIEKVVECFYNHDVDLVYGDISFFKDGDITNIKRRYKSDNLSKKNLAWGKMPAHPAIFIKRSIYEEIGNFQTNFKIAADYDFLCRLIKYPEFKSFYLEKDLVHMQLGGISTSGIMNTILLNKEVYRAIINNGIYTNIFMLLSKYPSKILQFVKRN